MEIVHFFKTLQQSQFVHNKWYNCSYSIGKMHNVL